MPGISIIIPVYNSEKYLESCLLSVERQSWVDYEVILIDDGSTDSSGTICNAFCNRNKRFHAYHEKNRGVSSARNYGLQKAQGDYVTFIDSDDEVSYGYLSTLMIQDRSDLVIAQSSSNKRDLYKNDAANHVISTYSVDEQSLCQLIRQRTINTVYAKRFRRMNIIDHGIRFRNDMDLGEDTLFLAEYLKQCKEFVVVNQIIYYYRFDDTRPTLSQYNHEYIKKLEYANNQLAIALSDIDPDLSKKDCWVLREWNVYYQAIIQILNSKRSITQKNQMIAAVFREHHFLRMVEKVDNYMAGDGKTFRKLIKKRDSLMLVLYWNCRKLLRRVFE